MAETPGWREIVKPYLEQSLSHSWVDPSGKDEKKLLYEYKLAYALAKAAQELLDFVENGIATAEGLTKKEKDEVKDKLREAIS